MLKLKHLEPLFIGGHRFCYIYPGDPDKCIKVLKPEFTGHERKKRCRTIKRYRPARSFDEQVKEIKGCNELIRKKNPRVWDHVPAFYGTEETDYGVGIITKLYRNSDGSYPANLAEILPEGMSPALEAGIEEFKQWIQREQVITRNLLPRNLIAVTREDGSQQIVVVDGVGNPEFIPISNWLSFCARKKIQRRLRFFQHRIDKLLAKC